MASKNPQEKIVIGIDPGTRITGYGILKCNNGSYTPLDYGCIRPPANRRLADRYLILFQSINALIEQYKPDELVVETQYVSKNVQSAIKLGMARGGVIIAARQNGLNVFEYAPSQAKLAVVGYGGASKKQVQRMVQTLLGLKEPPEPEDASDALALAICHAHASAGQRRLGKEM